MDSFKDIIIISAAALLLSSLWPVRRLLVHLPRGSVRRSWQWLSALLVLMIGGFLAHASGMTADYRITEELVIPSLMLFGSWFIFVVSLLSASGIESARRLSELEHQCVTDGLTGIYNRRHFDAQLQHEFQRAGRYGQAMSLMLIDIDHFKQLNDQHGHQRGDQVLRAVCETVQGLSRAADIVARYGGEEIAVICPNTSVPEARIQAERLRLAIAKQDFALGGERVTISLGVAGADLGEQDSPENLLRRADRALYEAKACGRNRVELGAPANSPKRVVDIKQWQASKKSHRAA